MLDVTKLPKWTVILYVKPDNSKYTGTIYAFFETNTEAANWVNTIANGKDTSTVVVRPFHLSDADRMHVLDLKVAQT